jgi:transposase
MVRARHAPIPSANHAAFLLGSITPAGAVEAARCELAAAFPDDLRRIDAQLGDAKKKLTAAVRASGTTLTKVFGVGPVVAATVVGDVRDVSRFPDRDHFAAYVGTAPIEVSSGPRKIYRLSAFTLGAAPSRAMAPGRWEALRHMPASGCVPRHVLAAGVAGGCSSVSAQPLRVAPSGPRRRSKASCRSLMRSRPTWASH